MLSQKLKSKTNGFTLIELLVIIAIIGLLATIVLIGIQGARSKASVSVGAYTQRQLQKALQLYEQDMGFYPPDTGRGADPGFSKPLPYNDDLDSPGVYDCNVDFTPCAGFVAAFSWLPPGWENQVSTNWKGPYVGIWPEVTPWGGEYDYNYWKLPGPYDRYGCLVQAGIYIGLQGDYAGNKNIPPQPEQSMIDNRYEEELCINGESQMLLVRFYQ